MTTHTFNPRPNPRPCAVLAMTVLLAASAQAQRIDVQPVVWEGWGPGVETGKRSSFSWQGKPLAFVPHQDFEQETAGFATGADVRIRWPQGKGRAANPGRVTAARIAVQDIAAPVLVAGADDDQVWDSGGMARAIADARAEAGRGTAVLVCPQAGHYLGGTGWAMTVQERRKNGARTAP